MAESDQDYTRIDINLPGIAEDLCRQVVQIAGRTRTILARLDDQTAAAATSPTQSLGFEFKNAEPPTRESLEKLRCWVCGLAITNAIESLCLMCDDLNRFLCLTKHHGAGPIQIPSVSPDLPWTIKSLAEHLLPAQMRSLKDFERFGLEKKLDALRKDHGVQSVWESELDSLYKLRNCLVHRLGRIAKEDCNNHGALSVVVRTFGLEIQTSDGRSIPFSPPMEIRGPASLHMRIDSEHRLSWTIGSQIALSEQDAEHIVFMLQIVGQQLVKSVRPHSVNPLPQTAVDYHVGPV